MKDGQAARPASPVDDLPAHDRALALTHAGGDAELAAELLSALLSGLPDEIEALRVAVLEHDSARTREMTHRMRGATRYCGVPALDRSLESLEQLAAARATTDMAAAFAEVESQAARLIATTRP